MGKISEDMFALSLGPDNRARSYSGCCVNGLRFHTLDRSSAHITSSCGVSVPGEHDTGSITFYGLLSEVLT